MRRWSRHLIRKLPSPRTVILSAGAVALVLWSLPADSTPWQLAGLHRQHAPHSLRGAVPTAVAVPDAADDAQASTSSNAQTGAGGRVGAHPLQTQTMPVPAQQPAAPVAPNASQPKTPAGQPQANATTPSPAAPGPAAPTPSPTAPVPGAPPITTPGTPRVSLPTDPAPFSPYLPWPTERMRVHVIDGRTQQPISGAEVVLIETEQRLTTGPDGWTPWFDAPIVRDPRFRPMVQELHGQLGVIVYKNGYRDAIHFGIRVHPGVPAETTVWMYKIGPGDTRIEPVFYEEPYHHIWLVELADRFRSDTQPGEGPERP